jgi:hypothetical protein
VSVRSASRSLARAIRLRHELQAAQLRHRAGDRRRGLASSTGSGGHQEALDGSQLETSYTSAEISLKTPAIPVWDAITWIRSGHRVEERAFRLARTEVELRAPGLERQRILQDHGRVRVLETFRFVLLKNWHESARCVAST